MGLTEVFILAVGLSMDACAVSICKGLSMKKIKCVNAIIIGLFFGSFQALMPLVGYFLGTRFKDKILGIDHWIAFGLLILIGGNMIYSAINPDEETVIEEFKLKIKELFLLAIATSIDAMAVGVSFAILEVNIFTAVATIGITTFVLSVAGVYLGFKFGSKYEKKSAIAGGVILILLGLKILVQDLEFMNNIL